MRPRCRWRIGLGSGLEPGLVPYRLLVSLIENRRVDGKVRQEHVADLGAVDGHLLASFYDGIDPAVAATVQGSGWTRASVLARFFFWQSVDQTLARLDNRIDATGQGQIRAAINARIPMLTIAEHDAIPQWETSDQVQAWHRVKDGFVDLVETEQRRIAHCEEEIEGRREAIARYQPAADELTKIVKDVEHEGPQGYEELYTMANSKLGEILAAKVRPMSEEEARETRRRFLKDEGFFSGKDGTE